MSVLRYIPIIGGWLEKIFGTVTESRNRKAEMAHEVELEMIKRGKGRPTPRMVMGYVVAFAFALCVIWSLVASFFPQIPPFPFEFDDLISLAGLLLGLGG